MKLQRFQDIVKDKNNAETTSSLSGNLATFKWWLSKLEETKKVFQRIGMETEQILEEQKIEEEKEEQEQKEVEEEEDKEFEKQEILLT